MVDLHRHSFSQLDEPRTRTRWGSLANERSIFELLGSENRLQPTPLTLAPVNANIYARRHSAHTCPMTEECPVPACTKPIPPAVPLRPPAVPKRTYVPPPTTEHPKIANRIQLPPVPHAASTRALPPIPVDFKPRPPIRNVIPPANADCPYHVTFKKPPEINKNASALQSKHLPVACTFEYTPNNSHEQNRIPSAPLGPPPPAPKPCHKTSMSSAPKPTPNQQCTTAKVSMRQDSSVSSDSFSQTSSPSYTTKTMETPLLPRTPIKQNNCRGKPESTEDDNGNSTITKSASTPASLQTIVRFHNGSNMSLHHRIIRDIRRPSSHYVRRKGLRFRFAQVVLNAIALLAIGGGMAAYFKAYPTAIHVTNNTISINNTTTVTPIVEKIGVNPAPGICLPVIVSFCQQHKVPYNFTVFPNYMGHFGQRDAQQELEVYDAVVDVRCYELAALFLCSVFVPKCGPRGDVVRPCRSLCSETKRRCGFFLDVFGLALPDYLECNLFPESADPDICVGHFEVKEAKIRSQKPVCPSGFQCDVKRCIPSDWKCDGHVDCKDQSDELNCDMCGPDMIHCGSDKCMIQEHMCDGKVDCPWAQDERNCLRLSERNGDEGRGRLEVYQPEQQKWVPACIDDWDSSSPSAICSLLGYSNSTRSQVLKANDLKLDPIQETTAVWRMYQNNRPKNILKEFGSCKGKSYRTVDITCTNYMCGKARKTYAESSAKRIVGGVRSKPGDWPFLAALLGGPEEIFYCAGVLIADEWVLTASHCVGNHSDVSGWTIQLGITRRHAHSYYGQKVKVRRVVPHPMYNLGIAHDNDVALFQLSSRVTFHEHLLPVCLPSANKVLHPGTMCTVIGWGKKEDTGMSEYEPEVNEVQVPVLNRDLCNSWLENRELNVTDGMICAGYKEGGKDACQGDSGGPLLCRDDEEPWFVGGIVSWGIKCAHPHLPGVYAYVPKYIPWILQQMKHYSD